MLIGYLRRGQVTTTIKMKLHDNFPGFRSYLADPRNELHLRALVVVDLELLVPLVVGSEGEGPRFHAAQARYRWMDLQYTSQRAPPKMSGGSPLCEGKGGFPMEPTGWG